MVPATCDICKRSLMIWDTGTYHIRRYDDDGSLNEVEVCICYECLLRDRGKKFPISKPKMIAPPVEPKKKAYDPGFLTPEPGAAIRFDKRRKEVPWARHTLWWFVHNAVAHPLIALLPLTPFFKFHDWTSYQMHGRKSDGTARR